MGNTPFVLRPPLLSLSFGGLPSIFIILFYTFIVNYYNITICCNFVYNYILTKKKKMLKLYIGVFPFAAYASGAALCLKVPWLITAAKKIRLTFSVGRQLEVSHQFKNCCGRGLALSLCEIDLDAIKLL